MYSEKNAEFILKLQRILDYDFKQEKKSHDVFPSSFEKQSTTTRLQGKCQLLVQGQSCIRTWFHLQHQVRIRILLLI